MNFVNFHWGDWARSTQDLTPLERGVYIDLLQRYYQKERPLMHEECKRIARAYAPDAQEAMHYVLGEFFIQEGDSYRHERCEIEIAKFRETVEKRVKASKARWSKEKAKKATRQQASDIDACNTKCNASGYAHAEQVQSECSANGMLPNTQYPIPNKEITPVGPLTDQLIESPSHPEEQTAATETKVRATRTPIVSTKKPKDLSEQTWNDWVVQRRAKKAAITETVIAEFRSQAEKAGITLEEAVKCSLLRDWRGFKAAWYLKDQNQAARSNYETAEERRMRELNESAASTIRMPSAWIEAEDGTLKAIYEEEERYAAEG